VIPPPDLTEKVIGCAIAVHRELGPGLLESVYRECLRIELLEKKLKVEVEKQVPLYYRGLRIGTDLKIDLLIEGAVVVELKAVDKLNPVFLAQVITYLKLAACPAGLLMNFNSTSLRQGLHRLTHPELFKKRETLSASTNPDVQEDTSNVEGFSDPHDLLNS
jgi:GxxExxY protein